MQNSADTLINQYTIFEKFRSQTGTNYNMFENREITSIKKEITIMICNITYTCIMEKGTVVNIKNHQVLRVMNEVLAGLSDMNEFGVAGKKTRNLSVVFRSRIYKIF